jgi:hypothetical protein
MKLGKLGLSRPTAPNGAGTQPAWRLLTPSCDLDTLPSAKDVHATDPHGELRGGVPCAGVGERPVARGRTRSMAVSLGDWRTRPAHTLGKPPNLAPRGTELRIQGPPPSAQDNPRAEPGGEPRLKLSAAGVAGHSVARGRADVRTLAFAVSAVFFLKIANWHQCLPLQPRLQAWAGAQIRRGAGQ